MQSACSKISSCGLKKKVHVIYLLKDKSASKISSCHFFKKKVHVALKKKKSCNIFAQR